MSLGEFDIIGKFFQRQLSSRQDVILGSGDDCAVVMPPPGKQLVMTIDALLSGVHFFPEVSAQDLAYKAVAVSLSDIAAMGGEPAWVLATLSMETVDETWLAAFAKGLFAICDEFNLALIGGDLTRGPLAVTTQLTGFVSQGAALCRDGARVGDKIYVTGTLGDAGIALAGQLQKIDLSDAIKAEVTPRLLRPSARVQAGRVLSGLASSCIDISDGLAQDLGHILKRSEVGARVDLATLPLSSALKTLPTHTALNMALTAGDDYELCFTIAPAREVDLLARQNELGVSITCIGEIRASGMQWQLNGAEFKMDHLGFQHF